MGRTIVLLPSVLRKLFPIWLIAVLGTGIISQGLVSSANAAGGANENSSAATAAIIVAPSNTPVYQSLNSAGISTFAAVQAAALNVIQINISLNQTQFLQAAGVCVSVDGEFDHFAPAIPVILAAPTHGSFSFGTRVFPVTCGGVTENRTLAAISYTWTDANTFRGAQDSFAAEWSFPGRDNFGANSWVATRNDGPLPPPPPSDVDISSALGDAYTGSCSTLDPCNIGTGNSYEEVTDYMTAGGNSLAFKRYYNSLATDNTLAESLGPRWSTNYDRYLDVSPTSVVAQRADGQILHFSQTDGIWRTKADIDISLTNNGSTWTLTDRNDTVETYTELSSGEGLLQQIVARDGYTQTLAYDSGMHLTSVTDSYGRKLIFTYNGSGLLTQVVTPDTLKLSYTYDAGGMLASVSYNTTPATQQIYSYVNQFDLASITDENGNVFASWTYDSQHRALTNQHANGVNLDTISYDTDTSRTVTNALGQSTVYDFTVLQSVPKITSISRTATATVPAATRSFTYDANGYVASETDWNGNVTTYVNDTQGNPTSITEASGTTQARTTAISYAGPRGRQPGVITAPRLTTALTYDAIGNVLTRTETDTTGGSTSGQTRSWAFTYDNTGHVLTATNPLGAITTFTYNGNNIASVTNALGHVSNITSYNGSGLPLSMTDANDVVTTLTYDERNRLLSRTIHDASNRLPPEDATTNFGYDAAGNLTAITLPDGAQLLYTYDTAHRVTEVKNNAGESINYTLDAFGGVTQTQVKGMAITKTQTAVFDSLGRMLQQIGAYNETTTLAYDSVGNLLRATNALNNTATRSFDALNRLITSTDPLHNATTYAFDTQDNLSSVRDPRGLLTSYTYNGFGEVIAQSSPDSGTTTYTLDAAGNRISEKDARGVVTNRTFDKLNRVLTEAYPAAAEDNISYTYDAGAFGIGRLSSFRDRSGTTAFTYDGRGNILTDSRTIGQQTYVTSYAYDLADRVTGITYPDKRSIKYARDAFGRISAVTMQNQGNGNGGKTLVSRVTYEPFGPLSGLVFGNGVATRLSHDLNYRLTGIATQGGDAVQSLTMVYDGVNDITSITDFIPTSEKGKDKGNLSHSQSFTYDANRRLLTAVGAYGSQSFGYDADGNRTGVTEVSGGANSSSAYAYAAGSNRLSAISGGQQRAFTYTASGATATETAPYGGKWYSQEFTYDSRDRNIGVTVRDGNKTGNTYYLYNALGQRVSKERTGAGRDHDESHGHARYIYDLQGNLIAEATNGQSTKNYVYIDGLPIAVMDGGQIHYIHTDHLGAPQKMTDDRQQIAWDRVAKPFGETFAINGNANLNLRFPGQYHDAETELDYNFFRSYDPALGRYTQSDPIGLLGGINTYGYAINNPLNLIDPSGLCFLSLANQSAFAGFTGNGNEAFYNAISNGDMGDQIAAWLGFTVGYADKGIYSLALGLAGGAGIGAILRAAEGAPLVYGPSAGGQLSNYAQKIGGQTLTQLSKPVQTTWSEFSIQTLNSAAANGRTVIFDLTNMKNIPGVLNGTAYQNAVTSTELRYIQSNWSQFSSTVRFVENGRPVGVPW